MRSARDCIEHVLSRFGLPKPDRRPLCRYHTTRIEVDELAVVVAEALQRPRVGPYAAMAFCLWASEWWRRHYESGPWKWEPLLKIIAHPEFAPGRPRYGDLHDIVNAGLRGWGRSVLMVGNHRGFLATLACEGGLPHRLLLKETHLRSYFRGVLEEFRLFGATDVPVRDLAERLGDRLPKGWRQPVVYEMAGELIREVWKLQLELGETTTPVRDLDRTRPGWRESLPIRVTDQIARALLNGLLIDAVNVASGGRIRVKWVVNLVRAGDEQWELRGRFRLPSTMSGKSFNRLFSRGSDKDVPHPFDLCVETRCAPLRPLAVANQRRDGGGIHFGLQALPSARLTAASGVGLPRRLVARSLNRTFSSDLFPGASGLTGLPWVFVGDPSEERSDAATYSLVAQGSARLKQPSAVVAVADGTEVERLQGSVEIRGLLSGGDRGNVRRLYFVSGKIMFVGSDGSRVCVETGSAITEAGTEYRLGGRKIALGRSATTAFLGAPTLHPWRDGKIWPRISNRDLQWKSNGPGQTWREFSREGVRTGQIVGTGFLRYVREGLVRTSLPVNIIPPGASVEIVPTRNPRSGSIRFVCFGPMDLSVVEPPVVAAETHRREETLCVELAVANNHDVPTDVNVALDWHGRGRAIFNLPFPARRARFLDSRGHELPNESYLAEGSVAGVSADVVEPGGVRFAVRGIYLGDDVANLPQQQARFVRPLPEVSPGHHQISLAMIQPAIRSTLAAGEDPRGGVRLSITCTDKPGLLTPTKVNVSGFDLEFERLDAGAASVCLDETSRGQVSPREGASLEVEAIPLLNPEADRTVFPRESEDNTWRIPLDTMDPGPYLILGREGAWHRVRPLEWHVEGDPVDTLRARSSDGASIMAAYAETRHGGSSMKSFHQVARVLGADPVHPDWPLVFEYLGLTSLPVDTFPILRAMARTPEACAMAAVRAGSTGKLDLLWERMDGLPFAWWQISLSCWEGAFGMHRNSRIRVFETPTADVEDFANEDVSGRIDRVSSRLPGLNAAFEFIKYRLIGRQLPVEAAAITRPEMLESLQSQYDACVRDGPVRGMSADDIPTLPGLPRVASDFDSQPSWSGQLFLPRAGGLEVARRWNLAHSPVVAALAVNLGVELPSQLRRAIRVARCRDPDWFDETMRLAQLISFGRLQAESIQLKREGGLRDV